MLRFVVIITLLLQSIAAFSQIAKRPSIGELKVQAEAGDATAANALGETYLAGFYYADALKWFQAAAANGVTNAQWRASQILIGGKHAFPQRSAAVPADPAQGVYWLKRAANAGHTHAQFDLGRCYQNGTAVSKDLLEAYKWLGLAASKGMIMARTYHHELSLKLATAEIAEGERRIKAFKPSTSFDVWSEIRLKGISGTGDKRFAIINTESVGAGDQFSLTIGGEKVRLTCEKIDQDSVVLRLGDQFREVKLHLEQGASGPRAK